MSNPHISEVAREGIEKVLAAARLVIEAGEDSMFTDEQRATARKIIAGFAAKRGASQ